MTRLQDPNEAMVVVINDDATLATTVRAAGDFDNSAANQNRIWCVPYLTVQFDSGPPSAGASIADLYVIPGSAEATELYPEGGDAGLGTDDNPQPEFYVGTFKTVNPSLTVDEVLALPALPLYPSGNRFVLTNTSGQTFDSTWQLEIMRWALE